MLSNTILSVTETTLNGYINLDPESSKNLEKLAGKIIAVELPFFKFYYAPTKTHLKLLAECHTPPDVTLQGSPLDFLRYTTSEKDNAAFVESGIKVTGNTDVAQDFKQLFSRIDIDWEEKLSHVTGDIIAHQIGNFFRAIRDWARQSSNTLKQDLSEYIHEEIHLFPAAEELQLFYKDVDHVRDGVERIDARIAKLHKKTTNKDKH